MKVYLANESETEKLGNVLGKLLFDGAVVCFNGDLGAGKTSLCKAISVGRGVESADVTSPTFTIMNIYDGDMEIRHFDFYRLESEEDLDNIGFDEYCGGSGITLIEWGELFLSRLPKERLDILLFHDGDGRRAEISGSGVKYKNLVKELESVYFRN